MKRLMTFGVVALIGMCGAAYAATSGGGRITVCVGHADRTLYKARSCARGDQGLSWNVQGPRGPEGLPGPGFQFTTVKASEGGPTLDQAGTYFVDVEADIPPIAPDNLSGPHMG